MAYTLTATYDNPPSAVLILTGDSAFSTTPRYRFKIYSDSAGTQLVTSSGWITLSEASATITYTVASINSGTYYVTAESDDPQTYISLQQVVLTDNTPKTATQAQWEDLASRVNAKANSSDVPSTYWGQTANNGAVSGMLSFGTNGYVNGTNTTVTIYADNSGGADPFSFSHSGFDVADKKITSLANGTASHDAVNKSQLDAKPTITMTSTDPGEGSTLAANNYVAVYGGDPIILDYSTSEINTGVKWINGSAIYKKTVDTGALPNAATKTVAHSISNLGKVIRIEGYATESSLFLPLPGVFSLANQSVQVQVTSTDITLYSAADHSNYTESYVTLYYTKSS